HRLSSLDPPYDPIRRDGRCNRPSGRRPGLRTAASPPTIGRSGRNRHACRGGPALSTTRRHRILVTIVVTLFAQGTIGRAPASAGTAFPDEPGRTTFTNPTIRYTVPEKPYVVLRRGEVEAIVVDQRAVDDGVLRGHRAGYSGLAALRHDRRRENVFVPAYAGLNFEHIHDGTTRPLDILFEPRNAPMELRRLDDHTAELYQRPTPHC